MNNTLVPLDWHNDYALILDSHRMPLLVGPPGVGKTEVAHAEAWRRTHQAPEVVQGTPEVESSHFWGQTELRGDETIFADGPLPRALRHGRHLIVEEINLIPHEVRATFLGVRGRSDVRHPGTGEVLSIPDEFRLVATSNTESLQCRSNGMLAQAVLDDFIVLEVPPLTEQTAAKFLARDFPQATAELRTEAIELWDRFRDVAQEVDKSTDDGGKPALGYRSLKHYVNLVSAGMNSPRAARLAFINRYITDKELFEAAELREMLQ